MLKIKFLQWPGETLSKRPRKQQKAPAIEQAPPLSMPLPPGQGGSWVPVPQHPDMHPAHPGDACLKEGKLSRVTPNVNDGLCVITLCQRRFINCSKGNSGQVMSVGTWSTWERPIPFPHFAMNIKLL